MMAPVISRGEACGKFILLGEHFVISAQDDAETVPALAFPLHGLRCEVKVKPHHHPHYKANLVSTNDHDAIEGLMARATYAAANSLRLDLTAQALSVESTANFPISRGFGSSAAFAVALVRALDAYRKSLINQAADWQELVKATAAVEHIFHGRPSGVDTAVVLAGRPIRFENGAVVRELVNKAVDFVVVDSGNRDNCATLVREVASFRERNRAQWSGMAQALRKLVDATEAALAAGAGLVVAASVREAHGMLVELGLSNPGIEALLQEAQSLGALGGKVSGAGGGGAVLLVTHQGDGNRLAQALRERGRTVVSNV